MTTAGRPTWNTAKGGRGKWEGDLSAQSKQYSARDLPGHTKLKVRQEGQGRPEEVMGRDFRKELEEREAKFALDKSSKSNYKIIDTIFVLEPLITAGSKRNDVKYDALQATKKSKPEISTANLDADDPWEEEYDDDAARENYNEPRLDLDEEDDQEDEDEEDEELLMAELAKIKRERAEEAAKQAAEKKAAEETIRMENILKGNPLLNNQNSTVKEEFKVKRRWDDDVVFKNCARGQVDHAKRGFVNDTLRSEFHKKFMKKYIQ
ncbi:complexed with cef1p [Cichlidogyrus casuarinus]|uniref:Complexed with cef1p n=1 Tax=Cichlidogyrus casuarinus TaxID=1844966 RepID=A0ABD2QNK4_9PLAT